MGYWGNTEEISRYWENYLQGKSDICDGAFCRLKHFADYCFCRLLLSQNGVLCECCTINWYRYNWYLHGYRGDQNIR